jgi:SAM-dependent methyltransferase
VLGVDLPDPKLSGEWESRTRPNLEFRELDVTGGLPFADGEFDLVCATEVLEHVPRPERVVAEMARVADRHLIVSVPHEPLWRILNVARGAYLRDLGNTPGHINHWTRRGFVSLLSNHGRVTEIRSPFPWTMLLVSVD